MTAPDIQGSRARGPAGTQAMGISVAVPAQVAPSTQEDWADFIREAQPQLLEMLKTHVGGAQPRTEPALNVDGPHSDPLQGPIYVMTASAWFYPASLPVDCTARKALSDG